MKNANCETYNAPYADIDKEFVMEREQLQLELERLEREKRVIEEKLDILARNYIGRKTGRIKVEESMSKSSKSWR